MQEERNPNYYSWYWGGCLPDLCRQLRVFPTQSHKQQIHDELKDYLGVKTISGMSDAHLRRFIYRVLMVCAREKGIYVRHRQDQPIDIEWMPLGEVWDLLD